MDLPSQVSQVGSDFRWTAGELTVITSLFRVQLVQAPVPPLVLHNKSGTLYSNRFGLGWRCGLCFVWKYDTDYRRICTSGSKTHVYFESYLAQKDSHRVLAVDYTLQDNAQDVPYQYSSLVQRRDITGGVHHARGDEPHDDFEYSFAWSNILARPYLRVSVCFSTATGGWAEYLPKSPSSTPHTSYHKALVDSMDRGTFVDLKFYTFSRRLSPGRIGGPVALYACKTLLKDHAGESFGTLLSAHGFAESKLQVLAQNSVHPELETDDYGYESDSDLEDSESAGNEIVGSRPPIIHATSASNRRAKTTSPVSTGRTIFVKDVA